jgi:predicted nucleotidyltransferase component of viral defense system
VKPLKNVPASVRQRLLNRSRSEKRPFNELLQYYAMERFLYRLSQSEHREKFILKGALMLRAWRSPEFRPTKDIDMLGITSNDESRIVQQIRDIMALDVEPDGLSFDGDSMESEQITEDAEYKGVRVTFLCYLGSAKINMQIDVGFGDVVHPCPEDSNLPTMLDYPQPRLRGYTRDSVVAEKFETMVKRGDLNSRMKDFYDIWLLSRQFEFDTGRLADAIRLTFQKRGTEIPGGLDAFDRGFADAKQVQWVSFRRRLGQDHVPKSFHEIVSVVREFLTPVVASIGKRNSE